MPGRPVDRQRAWRPCVSHTVIVILVTAGTGMAAVTSSAALAARTVGIRLRHIVT